MAIGTPAARALPPTLVPAGLLPSAMTLRSIASQSAQVAGPALGGLLYAVSPTLVYVLAAALCLLASVSVVMIRARPRRGHQAGNAGGGALARHRERAGRACGSSGGPRCCSE